MKVEWEGHTDLEWRIKRVKTTKKRTSLKKQKVIRHPERKLKQRISERICYLMVTYHALTNPAFSRIRPVCFSTPRK